MTPLLQSARTARALTVDVLSGGGDVLVLAPHPGDETLGCGGAIAALTDLGQRAQVIVVTDGGHSHPVSRSTPPERLRQMRASEVARADEFLTFGMGPAPVLLAYPDTDATEGDAAVDAALARIMPHMSASTTAVWSALGGDPHTDNGRTARLAARNPALAHWSYPISGRFDTEAADFRPDALVQFETHCWQDRKAAAIAAHVSQMTGLISDDPGGFRMTDAQQRHFLTGPESSPRKTAP